MNVADFGVFNTSNLVFFSNSTPTVQNRHDLVTPLQLPAASTFCSSLSAPKTLRGCRCPWTISRLLFFDIITQIDSDNVIGYLNV